MTELKKNDQYEVEGLSKDSIVIPKGYDFVLVKVGEQDHVESSCPQCGGASLHTSPACVYCGTGRTHYEYKKTDSANEAGEIHGQTSMMDSVTVEQGSFEGKIWANEVRIGSESEVGDVIGGDNVYMENGAKAGFVYSPILRTGQGVKITQLATSVLTSSRGLRAGIVTIFDGGEASFPIGSRIEELRLGIGVKEPGWLTKLGIKKIVTGQSIPVPPEWEK